MRIAIVWFISKNNLICLLNFDKVFLFNGKALSRPELVKTYKVLLSCYFVSYLIGACWKPIRSFYSAT